MKRSGDCGSIGRESIGRDLEFLVRRGVADSFDKHVCGGLVEFAESDIENQLRVALDCNECVGVAKILIVFGANSFLQSHVLL
jgi:hypothetical protein